MNILRTILAFVLTDTTSLNGPPSHAQAIQLANENRATVYFPNVNKKKFINNLGWLLRHWKDIEYIETFDVMGKDSNCILIAKVWVGYCGNEAYYITKFNHRSVAEKWISRSIFHGIKLINSTPRYSDDCLTLSY
jgi:hypothetical protein